MKLVAQVSGRRYMGGRRIFFRGGKLGGLKTKVHQQGPGVDSRWGSVGKALRSRRKIVKIMLK